MARFLITRTFKSPLVYTGAVNPKRQGLVRYITFKKGSQIIAEMKRKSNGEPDFVLYRGRIVVPITAVKELVTKQIINSNADGGLVAGEKRLVVESKSKVGYIDTAIIGAILGFGAMILAEKKGWISEPENSKVPHPYKLTGAGIGAALGIYYKYRKNVKSNIKVVRER